MRGRRHNKDLICKDDHNSAKDGSPINCEVVLHAESLVVALFMASEPTSFAGCSQLELVTTKVLLWVIVL